VPLESDVRLDDRNAEASLGLGLGGSVGFVPAGLEATYGTGTPAGTAMYTRLRPALVQPAPEGHGGENRENEMGEGT
jgi:hypothetical protein